MHPFRLTRPMLFALNSMLSALILLTQGYFNTDIESLLMLICVTKATMRPLMQGAETPLDVLTNAHPNNDERGSISRRMIAEKPRLLCEMVRRRARKLAKAGLIDIDDEGRVRSVQLLDAPASWKGSIRLTKSFFATCEPPRKMALTLILAAAETKARGDNVRQEAP